MNEEPPEMCEHPWYEGQAQLDAGRLRAPDVPAGQSRVDGFGDDSTGACPQVLS